MPTFGEFETLGRPYAESDVHSHVSTIWQARKSGAAGDRLYAVKCYAPHRRAPSPGQPEEALAHDRRLEFLEGIKQIKKAQSEGGRGLAPIHALGTTATEAWYVTDFYPRKDLQAWIDRKGEVNGAALRHVVSSVVTACLALKRSRGCSHGNLKPSNIFLAGKPRDLRKTPLLLADAYPAAPLQIARLEADDRHEAGELLNEVMEAQDLAAIGKLILQLVEGRLLSRSDDYNYPVAHSREWDALGKESEYWLQWCNKLLDPQLSLETLNLETLATEFRPSAAAAKLPLIAGVAVGICVLVSAGTVVAQWAVKTHRRHSMEAAFSEADTLKRKGNFPDALKKVEYAGRLAEKLGDQNNKSRANAGKEDVTRDGQRFKNSTDAAESAEAGTNWSAAMTNWMEAAKLCPEESKASNGVVFARAMIDALGKLAVISNTWEVAKSGANELAEAQKATNVCGQILSDLAGLDRLVGNMEARKSRLTKLRDSVNGLSGDASNRIAALSQDRDCRNAKAAATGAEGTNNWTLAASLWKEAEKKCRGDQEITNGIAFATGMTSALGKLAVASKAWEMAKGGANELAEAQKATNVCGQILSDLAGLDRLVGNTEARKSRFTKLRDSVNGLSGDASGRIAALSQDQSCRNAKAAAAGAETTNDWHLALSLWQQAAKKCPGDSGIAHDIEFVEALTNALEFVKQARGLTNSQPSNAEACCKSALRKLDLVGQSATGEVRSKAVEAIRKTATEVLRVAQTLGEQAKQKENLRSARALFDQGNYDGSLGLCNSHPNVADFDSLAKSNRTEQAALNGANAEFTVGVYSFLDQLKNEKYITKPPFTNLLQNARLENKVFTDLCGFTNRNDWSGLNQKLISLGSASYLNKTSFVQLRAWHKNNNPEAQLTTELNLFKVWSGVDKRNTTNVVDPNTGKKAVQLPPNPVDQSYYARLGELKKRYTKLYNGTLPKEVETTFKQIKSDFDNR